MPNTPEQRIVNRFDRSTQATRYMNASTKLGSITDVLSALSDRNEHGEGIDSLASTTLHYLNQLCETLDTKAAQLRAGHTSTPHNTLRGHRVYYHCICGFEADSEDKLVDHISYMVTNVGDSNARHGSR